MGQSLTCIRALVFDLDDTLWDNPPLIAAAEQAQYAYLQEHLPALTQAVSYTQVQAARLHFAQYLAPKHVQVDLSALRRAALSHLIAPYVSHHPEKTQSLAEGAFQAFWHARQQVQDFLFADTLSTLAYLYPRYPLGVLTNGNADLHHIGLAHYFQFSYSAAEVGAPKPEAALFARAQAHLGLAPQQLMYIGDDPYKDVQAAQALGWHTSWIDRGLHPKPAHLQPSLHLRQLRELCHFF